MRFHLDHIPKRAAFDITHGDSLFLLGSCFSDSIRKRLQDHDFRILSNPSGTLFNPHSMRHCLDSLLNNMPADEKQILNRDGVFLSYAHHSSIHDMDKNKLLEKIRTTHLTAAAYLKETDILILTFGSAFVYHHLALNRVVANCHKQPAGLFEKRMLSPEEIVADYSDLIHRLKIANTKLKIIFTLSPVKYLRDGLAENNLSKSVLLVSIHQLIQRNADCFYFPAYELVNDDLRDYRFYKEDLAHPNEQAVAYVWEKFSDCLFNAGTQRLNQQIYKLNQALGHRNLMNREADEAGLQAFITKQKELIAQLKSELGS